MGIARPLTLVLKSTAIGVGVLFFGGSALADSSPAPAESPAVTVSSSSNTNLIIDDQSTTADVKGQALSDGAATVIQSDNGAVAEVQSPSKTVIIAPASIKQSTDVVSELETLAEAVIPAALTSHKSTEGSMTVIKQSPVAAPISLRSNLASAKYFSYSRTFFESITTPNQSSDNAANASPILQSKAPMQDPTPVQPFGMMSALLALFSEAVPGIFAHSFALEAIGYTALLIVLTMVALAVSMTARTTVVSYGTWLKQTGFTSVARSGLPAFSSSFAIPSMMGYVSAPAPYA